MVACIRVCFFFLRQNLIGGKLIQPAVRHRNCVLSLISLICLNSHRVCFYRILVLIIFSKIILMQFAGDTNMTHMCTAVNGNNAECGVIYLYLSSGPETTRRELEEWLADKAFGVNIMCVRPHFRFANVKGNQLRDRVKLCDFAGSVTSA